MAQQIIDFLHAGPGAASDAFAAASVHYFVVQTLMSTVLIGFSVAAMGLAALGAVFLLFASRRATLRQMNLNLVEITEQLKQLRSTWATMQPSAPQAGMPPIQAE